MYHTNWRKPALFLLVFAFVFLGCSDPVSTTSPVENGSEAAAPLSVSYVYQKGGSTYQLTVTHKVPEPEKPAASVKAVVTVADEDLPDDYIPQPGDTYVLIIITGEKTQTSAGTVTAYSNNTFTLKPDKATASFTVRINSEGNVTSISGTITYNDGTTIQGPDTTTSGGGGGGTTIPTNPTPLTGTVTINKGNTQVDRAQVGDTLTAVTSNLRGTGDITYQWRRRGNILIVQTTSPTYVVQQADSGTYITVAVARSGNTGSVTSPQVVITNQTISAAVTGVTLNKSSTSLNTWESETLTATVAPSNATNKDVTWSSSNPAVATVESGLVRAVAPGQAIITVTTVDGGKTAICTVNVNANQDGNGQTVYLFINFSRHFGVNYHHGYWLNDKQVYLTPPSNSRAFFLIDYSVSGNDVYVAGFYEEGDSYGRTYCYWKNGELFTFPPEMQLQLKNPEYIRALTVSGNDIYLLGNTGYWKNGVFNALEGTDVNPQSIGVYGNDVYVSGYVQYGSGGWAGYWKNGVFTSFGVAWESNNKITEVGKITMSGSDVYIAGFITEGGVRRPGYWKNGTFTKVELPAPYVQAVSSLGYILSSCCVRQ